jgi:hypothetical protein
LQSQVVALHVHCFTSPQWELRTLRTPDRPHGLTIMELIIGSLVMAAGLLLGHFGVLVRNRLLAFYGIAP